MGGTGEVREWRDRAKRKKDSWTWTSVWRLLVGGGVRELNGNGKNTIDNKFLKRSMFTVRLFIGDSKLETK